MTKDNLIWLTKEIYRLTLLFPKKEPLRYKMREIADDILAKVCGGRTSANSTSVNTFSIKNPAEVRPPQLKNKITEDGPLPNLEVLDGFFEVAKEQNWVSPEEILKLQENYSKLGEEDKSSSLPFTAARVKEELKTETDLEMTLTLPLDKEKEAKDEFTPLESSALCPTENQKSLKKSKTSSFLTGFIMLPAEENSSIPELQRRVEAKKTSSSSLPSLSLRESSVKNECSSISERQEKILAFLKEQGRAQVWQIKQVLPEVTKRTLRRDFESLLKKRLVERIGERNNTFYQVPSERGERRESNSLRTKITQA